MDCWKQKIRDAFETVTSDVLSQLWQEFEY